MCRSLAGRTEGRKKVMKVAVSAIEPTLESRVDARFGRCAYFIIVNTDDQSYEAIVNPNLTQGSGAGIQSGRLMSEKSVDYVLTGNCGPNAYRTLNAAGIRVITGCEGTVAEVTAQLSEGKLTEAAEPNVESHFGMS